MVTQVLLLHICYDYIGIVMIIQVLWSHWSYTDTGVILHSCYDYTDVMNTQFL